MTKRTAITVLVIVSGVCIGATITLIGLFAAGLVDWYWPIVVGVVTSGWIAQTWREVRAVRRGRRERTRTASAPASAGRGSSSPRP